ncbi:putative Transcriptional regulator, XRE family [Rhodospirillaceae bacterium LM-1]|nr:putative Transcriptional regulator, XRE family [Rhodospirillaceae bacterium LM-1]
MSRSQSCPSSSLAPSQDFLAHLGQRLENLRQASGFERAQLAKCVGITGGRLKKIEEGQARLEASLLYALLVAMNVKVAEFFDGAAHVGPSPLDPETQELMRLFGAIPDPGIRRSILKLAKSLSEKP